ncbi:hypothetical protein BLNAU_19855 [Blattamonas nauphoetae]|uniref:Protein kinase domain-containing protein n=1 Tax=Blattamonas nauphoetae TaxID=2049346 RepID=A0ABQ9X0C5_9EUKA|nr:hypothetical protein BLNAU_19855 [Blattamonas nauphoetae]
MFNKLNTLPHPTTESYQPSTFCSQTLAVSGIGMSLSDFDLCLATGPLIGSLESSVNSAISKGSVQTRLIGSALLNSTSSFRNQQTPPDCQVSLSQSMVGTSVSSSTNHLYGTGIQDMNSGGCLLCQNSSFISCSATSSHQSKAFQTQTDLKAEHSPFTFDRCTFKTCSGHESGGAIHFLGQAISIQIQECSFDSCSVDEYASGGAMFLYIQPGSSSSSSISLASSSFVGCSCVGGGGSVNIRSFSTFSITDCVFLHSEVEYTGGAVGIELCQADFSVGNAITNCIFQNCTQTDSIYDGGGAIETCGCPSVRYSSLQFRWCSAGSGNGHDILGRGPLTPTLDENTVTDCDSQSDYPNRLVFIESTSTDCSDLLSRSLTPHQILSIAAFPQGDTADLAVTLDKEISGRLLVLISNVGGTRQPGSSGFPNIGRFVTFHLSSSLTDLCSVRIGETGLLQQPLTDYSVIAASHSGHLISFNGVSLCTPRTLNSVRCTLDENQTTATITFRGEAFPAGRYVVTLHDRTTLEVDFSIDSEGFMIGSHNLGVIGDGTKWKEGSVWIVTGVECVDDPSSSVIVDSAAFFTIPVVPSEVTGIGSPSLNKRKTEVSFEILSRAFPSSISAVTLKLGWRKVTSSSFTIGNKTSILISFPATLSTVDNSCKFGQTYTLASIGASKTIAIPSGLDITIPFPPLITSVATRPSSSPNEFVLMMEGVNLPRNEVFLAQVGSFAPIRVTMSGDGQSGVSDPIRAGQSHTIQFNTSYTVKTLRKDGDDDEHILLSSPTFTTPLGPMLASISCPLSASDPNFVVLTVGGERLVNDHYFLILQKGSEPSITIEMQIASNLGVTSLLAFGSGELEYSGKYAVKRMWSESVEVVVDSGASLLTVAPAPARIESALCVLSVESEKKEATLTLTGSSLPLNTDITIEMKPLSSDGHIVDSPVSFDFLSADTASTIIIKVDMYAAQHKLEFGTKYEVTSLHIDGTPFVLNPNIQFSVPIAPVRVEGVSVVEISATTIEVKISGSGFIPEETYTLAVSGSPSNGGSGSSHEQTITVVTLDTNNAASSAIVLGTDESALLRSGYTYTILSITNGSDTGFVEGTPTFETPSFSPSHPRIHSASVDTNGQKTRMWIIISGENLVPDLRFTLTLNHTLTVEGVMMSSSEGRSEEVKLGFPESLSFSSKYRVTDVSNSEGDTIPSNGIEITTPSKPTELTLFVCSEVSDTSDQSSGTEPSSCLPIERAWEIAEVLSVSKTKMEIVESAKQSSILEVSSHPFNLMSGNMHQSELSLFEPSSNTNTESVLLRVNENGECRLTLLSILVRSSSSSFVFISAEGGSVTIQTCSISSTPFTHSINEDSDVCSWSNGLLHLSNTTTILSAVTVKNVVQGGIVQKGGELTITKGEFSQNGPTHSVFPSARQNVHCEEEGNLTIDKSTVEDTDSLWIDVGDCDFTGSTSFLASPLFVPSLNTNESKSEIAKNGKSITLTLKGEMLMPCGLSLEVFEWNKAKDVKGKSDIVELSTDKTTKWTETEIVAKLSTETDVKNLSSSLEWRSRLLFGDGVVRSEWMVIGGAGSGNKVEGGVGSMWWLPVIIVLACALLVSLVVALICCGRRQKAKLLLSNQELDGQQMEEMIVKEEESPDMPLFPKSTDVSLIAAETMRPDQDKIVKTEETDRKALVPSSNMGEIPRGLEREAVRCEEPFQSVVVNGTDTLFNRLHKNGGHEWKKLQWKVVAHSLTKGLIHLWKRDPHSDVLSRLNPHNVVLDEQNTPCLVLPAQANTHPTEQYEINHKDEGTQKETETSDPVPIFQQVQRELQVGQGDEKKNEEGQRWEAPEVSRTMESQSKNGIDQAKACVFSLGLVMCEMATQLVPFGEIDGVNAHRQIGSGVTPRIDGLGETMEGKLIVRCLTLNPKERPTLNDVKVELEDLLKMKEGNEEEKASDH